MQITWVLRSNTRQKVTNPIKNLVNVSVLRRWIRVVKNNITLGQPSKVFNILCHSRKSREKTPHHGLDRNLTWHNLLFRSAGARHAEPTNCENLVSRKFDSRPCWTGSNRGRSDILTVGHFRNSKSKILNNNSTVKMHRFAVGAREQINFYTSLVTKNSFDFSKKNKKLWKMWIP